MREIQPTGAGTPDRLRRRAVLRCGLAALLPAGIALLYLSGADGLLSMQTLQTHHEGLQSFVGMHHLAAIAVFVLAYAAITALSVPGAFVLSIAGGFLFGTWLGGLYIVIGASVGSILVFLIARTALGEPLRRSAGPGLRRMEAGFRDDAFHYLLVLRLVPLFPFFLVNIVPAFLGVSLRTYTLATVIGIVPGALIFAQVGHGLESMIEMAETIGPEAVLTPEAIAGLAGLSVLAILPVAYRRWRAARRPVSDDNSAADDPAASEPWR